MDISKLTLIQLALSPDADDETRRRGEKAVKKLIAEEQQSWVNLSEDDRRKKALDEFAKLYLANTRRPRTVTEFISTRTIDNGDSFYTPAEERYQTHDEAVRKYNDKWNQNRGQPTVWTGPGQNDFEPDPSCCGADECDHVEHEGPHTKMVAWLELPYGHICDCCGGSMVAIIQLGDADVVLKTLLIYCG